MNLSLLTNKQMEMRTNKFMIYVFSAIMLGEWLLVAVMIRKLIQETVMATVEMLKLLMYGGLRELLKHVTTCYLMMIKQRMPKVP